jgi:hypothetical protein
MKGKALRRLMPNTGQSFELVNQFCNRFRVFKHFRELAFDLWFLVFGAFGLGA